MIKKDENRTMTVNAKTTRFYKQGDSYQFLGYSSNRGLECYLGEALARSGRIETWAYPELSRSCQRLLEESRQYKGYQVWGWERKPSIKEIYFPLDWDDTSKALDFLFLLKGRQDVCVAWNESLRLPDSVFWEKELRQSLFSCRGVGVDVFLPCDTSIALSVFFGPDSSQMPPREDPMVTVTTIRTTAFWFPSVLAQMYREIIELLRRSACVLNYVLQDSIPFSSLSRYYLSAGHYAFRLVEAANAMGLNLEEIGLRNHLISKTIRMAIRSVLANYNIIYDCSLDEEIKWWLLTGLLLGQVSMDELDSRLFMTKNEISNAIIFRHRRLGHYYSAEGWLERLQQWEYERLTYSHIARKAA